MKTHSIRQSISGQRLGRQAFRLVAIYSAVTLCAVACTSATAQNRVLGDLMKSPASQIESANMVRNGLFLHGEDSYRVVNTAAFRTAADIGETESGTVAQVGLLGNCRSCGTQCDGGCASYSDCGSCGTSCGGSCGYGGFSNPCAPCVPYRYALIEAVYMERGGERAFTTSPNFGMNGFDDEWGSRITIGTVPDCVHGCEVSYTGELEWNRAGALSDAGFGIGTFLQPGLPLVAADLSAFSNASFQGQTYSADYWSIEANKTLMGWDVAKLLFGARYIDYDERYNYISQNATETGLLQSAVDNQLFGIHVGMDLLYPVCRHGYTDFRARIGGFINAADSDVRLRNGGSTVFANFDDDEDIAGVFEIGSGFRYQVGEILSLRAGVELWYLSGVATAPDQFRSILTPATGRRIRLDDDVVFTGLSVGAEMRF